jgi:cytochrome c553
MRAVSLIAGLALAGAPAPALAQAQGPDAGNEAAKAAAPGNEAAKAAANCAACHGARGEGNPAAGSPRLAAQSQYYLSRQLRAYADGSRDNAVMTPIAKALTPQQWESLAAHYANLDAPPAQSAAPASAKTARGRTLGAVGDERRQIQACENCHGPGGTGEPPDNPYLAGQIGKYLQAALEEFKNGTRKTDPTQQMPMISRQLGPDDIAAVSEYYASQHPPKPAPTVTAQLSKDARTAKPGDTPTQPGAGSQPAQGTGTEQGSPTLGGTQGPGGGGGPSGSSASGGKSGGTP